MNPDPRALLCALCAKPLRDARLLECGHKCCAACAALRVAARAAELFAEGKDESIAAKERLACLECGKATAFGERPGDGGEAEMALERVRMAVQKAVCWCGAAAVARCAACREKEIPCVFCEEHRGIHDRMFGHKAAEMEEMDGDAEIVEQLFPKKMCETHRMPLKYACVKCDARMCAECIAKGVHVDHEYSVCGMSGEDEKRTVMILEETRKITERLQQCLSPDFDELVKEVKGEYEMMHEKLRDEEEHVLAEIEKARAESDSIVKKKDDFCMALRGEIELMADKARMLDKLGRGSNEISVCVDQMEEYMLRLGEIVNVITAWNLSVSHSNTFDRSQNFVSVELKEQRDFMHSVGRKKVLGKKRKELLVLRSAGVVVDDSECVYVQTNSDIASTKAVDASIPAGFSNPCSGVAAFDPNRRWIFETSSNVNGGRDIFITELNEDGTKGTLKMAPVSVPYGQRDGPLFDGEQYLYFHQHGGTNFGRLDTVNMVFETLKGPSTAFHDKYVNTFFSGNSVFAFDMNGKGTRYDVHTKQWSKTSLTCSSYERFFAHPWDSKKVICVTCQGVIRVCNIETGAVEKQFNSQLCSRKYVVFFGLALRAPENEFYFVFGNDRNRNMLMVFSSKDNTWTTLSVGPDVYNGSSAIVLDERTGKIFFHPNDKPFWSCAQLPQ